MRGGLGIIGGGLNTRLMKRVGKIPHIFYQRGVNEVLFDTS